MYDRQALIALVQETALEHGDFTLASGKKAKFYLDCRKLTLDSRGANLIADGILELLGDQLPDAVGGMAVGADPITGAVI
ncbi:MAG: orotate phosphoribosyltransferase, partial [Planctomycetota bacterium]